MRIGCTTDKSKRGEHSQGVHIGNAGKIETTEKWPRDEFAEYLWLLCAIMRHHDAIHQFW